MFQHLKRLLSHTLIYGLGNFVSKGVMFLLVPVLTNTIAPDEYGKFGIAQTFIGLAEVFFMLGMRQAILRYAVKAEFTRSQVYTAGVLWIGFSSALFLALLAGAGATVDAFLGLHSDKIFRSMLIILVIDAFSNAPFAALQSEQKPGYYMGLRLAHVAVYFSLCLYFIFGQKRTDVNAILEANIAASAFQLLCGLPIYLRLFRPAFNRPLLKGMLLFGAPYVPNLVFVIAIDLLGRVFLGRWLSMEDSGYFNAAYRFANLLYIIITAFQTAWQPFFLDRMEKSDGPNLFARVLTYYTLTAGLVFLFMGLFYMELASLKIGGFTLIGPAYRAGLHVVPTLLLAYVFCGAYYNFLVGIYAKEKTVYIPLITLSGAAVNVVVNVFAIRRFGIDGAAAATLCSYATMVLLLYPVSRRLYMVTYEWGRILRIALLCGACFGVGTLSDLLSVKITCSLAFLPLLAFSGFFTADEKSRVRGLLPRFFKLKM